MHIQGDLKSGCSSHAMFNSMFNVGPVTEVAAFLSQASADGPNLTPSIPISFASSEMRSATALMRRLRSSEPTVQFRGPNPLRAITEIEASCSREQRCRTQTSTRPEYRSYTHLLSQLQLDLEAWNTRRYHLGGCQARDLVKKWKKIILI